MKSMLEPRRLKVKTIVEDSTATKDCVFLVSTKQYCLLAFWLINDELPLFFTYDYNMSKKKKKRFIASILWPFHKTVMKIY